MSEKKVLTEILKELQNISQQLVKMQESFTNLYNFLGREVESRIPENANSHKIEKQAMPTSLEIMNLQESRPGLFNTYKAIQKKEDWVTSTDIAAATGRSRGLESRYLNYLADNGFVLKKRVKVTPDSKATEVWYKILGVDE